MHLGELNKKCWDELLVGREVGITCYYTVNHAIWWIKLQNSKLSKNYWKCTSMNGRLQYFIVHILKTVISGQVATILWRTFCKQLHKEGRLQLFWRENSANSYIMGRLQLFCRGHSSNSSIMGRLKYSVQHILQTVK